MENTNPAGWRVPAVLLRRFESFRDAIQGELDAIQLPLGSLIPLLDALRSLLETPGKPIQPLQSQVAHGEHAQTTQAKHRQRHRPFVCLFHSVKKHPAPRMLHIFDGIYRKKVAEATRKALSNELRKA